MQYQTQTYRGCAQGWVNVGRPKDKDDALALVKYINRVQHTFIHRIHVLPVELFPIKSALLHKN